MVTIKLLAVAGLFALLSWRSIKNKDGRIAFLSSMAMMAALGGAV